MTETQTMLGNVPIVKLAEQEDFIKMLVYGDPGAGKTYLAGTADDVLSMRPVLIVDIEGGTKTIRALHPDIDVIRVRDQYDEKGRLVKTAWERLAQVYEDLRKELPYKTIIVDSLTEAQKMSMYSVMARTVQGDPMRDIDIPAQRDWGKSSEMVRRMVRSFRDIDCHVIFTALSKDVRDPLDGKVTYTPSLPGKLAFEISAFLDIVLYLYSRVEKDEQVIRRVLSQTTGKYIAKDRSGRLPTTMDNPSMSAIADLALDTREG